MAVKENTFRMAAEAKVAFPIAQPENGLYYIIHYNNIILIFSEAFIINKNFLKTELNILISWIKIK